MFNGI